MENKRVIILLGPPGAGKNSQAQLLAEAGGFVNFETSKILEESFAKASSKSFVRVAGKNYYLKNEKLLWGKGMLCSPPFVTYLIKEKIKKLFRAGESIVFSGSPRTLGEAEELVPLLERLYGKKEIKVIFIDIPPEETIARNSKRRICSLMRHSIIYSEETKNLTRCPLDGSKLITRKGLDDPQTIKVRLKEFKERTFPLIEYLRKRGLVVKKVNGVGSVAEVFERIKKALKFPNLK